MGGCAKEVIKYVSYYKIRPAKNGRPGKVGGNGYVLAISKKDVAYIKGGFGQINQKKDLALLVQDGKIKKISKNYEARPITKKEFQEFMEMQQEFRYNHRRGKY